MKFIDHCKIMAKAGLQLKNLKSFKTQDGGGWSCTIYLNNKSIGSAFDSGHGCGVETDISQTDQKVLADAIKAAGYAPNLECNGIVLIAPETDLAFLEWALTELSGSAQELKRFKRMANKHLILVFKGAEEGTCEKSPYPYTPEFAAELRVQLGGTIDYIVNEEIAAL